MDFVEDCQLPAQGAKEGGCDSKTLPWMILAAVVVAILLLLWYSGWALWESEGMLPGPLTGEKQPAPGSVVGPDNLQGILY